ncbi:MAG: 16S rRNA (adenine(1518)-N(6)/adenine(1519)-N(6))-dimethyltransferase RsmA [Puniceicoccales bacterium]|jgi:16S rRNA (adenine1518-N6/adenine1519-N6)-dimethyltransferase|nr:16S rRNA (adenine(1518)-N(6)/adenine(1519)-N(6))-dimethyltransferase RsmA [Puniceicoccales bacterium]
MTSLLGRTKAELEKLGIRPSKRLGQNFLVDGNSIGKLLSLADVRAGDTVVEIGAGLGAISEKILEAGASLFAVEIDGRLCDFLLEKFADRENFHLKCADAVHWPVAGLWPEISDFSVVANVPYAISSPWADAMLAGEHLPRTVTLVLQMDVARRFFATHEPSEICPISIFLQSAYDKICMHRIPRTAFYPPPSVASVLLSMAVKPMKFLFKRPTKLAIRKIFTKRRKQMGGIVAGECLAVQKWASENNISSVARPEEISMEQWQLLDKFF